MERESQKTVQEYFLLVEKSQQLFAGLRDLPQFGRHWQPYFQKTFEIYTKLWRYQQQHRAVLENKDIYGLKRWEIGEIASKIGQLYYHYYLRTSETTYLEESFVFYEAIRLRDYFKDVFETKNPLLVVKKLRYYARYIVVCLLLNRRALVVELVDELQTLVDDYVRDFKPADAAAWRLVLQEINLFLQVDCPLAISDRAKEAPALSNRLKLPPSGLEGKIRLQEAILVGNYQHQVKFSELTLDMFRVMQVLERERVGSAFPRPSPLDHSPDGEDKAKKRSNPHKFLLYRPTFSQFLVFLSTAFKELHDNNVLLVYLSADGLRPDEPPAVEGRGAEAAEQSGAAAAVKRSPLQAPAPQQRGVQRTSGGVAMAGGWSAHKSQPQRGGGGGEGEEAVTSSHAGGSGAYASQCLYPADLLPFTRKKLFLIVESDNSAAFRAIDSAFGQPFLCLLSPVSTGALQTKGNLFTLFFHDPLAGFCVVINKQAVTQEAYDKCTKYIQSSFDDVQKLLWNFPHIPREFHQFLEEDFLQAFILRFIFCHSVLYLHRKCHSKPECLPASRPALPREFLAHPVVLSIVFKLASFLSVTEQFAHPDDHPETS